VWIGGPGWGCGARQWARGDREILIALPTTPSWILSFHHPQSAQTNDPNLTDTRPLLSSTPTPSLRAPETPLPARPTTPTRHPLPPGTPLGAQASTPSPSPSSAKPHRPRIPLIRIHVHLRAPRLHNRFASENRDEEPSRSLPHHTQNNKPPTPNSKSAASAVYTTRARLETREAW